MTLDDHVMIPAVLTFLDLLHHVDVLSALPGSEVPSDRILLDFQVQAWGGALGLTPRTDPHRLVLERALLPLVEAVRAFPGLPSLTTV